MAEAPQTNTFQLKSQGKDVKDIQQRLIALGYLSGEADGLFGPDTESAVEAFQNQHSLPADGIVGPSTMTILMSTDATPIATQARDAQKTVNLEDTIERLSKQKAFIDEADPDEDLLKSQSQQQTQVSEEQDNPNEPMTQQQINSNRTNLYSDLLKNISEEQNVTGEAANVGSDSQSNSPGLTFLQPESLPENFLKDVEREREFSLATRAPDWVPGKFMDIYQIRWGLNLAGPTIDSLESGDEGTKSRATIPFGYVLGLDDISGHANRVESFISWGSSQSALQGMLFGQADQENEQTFVLSGFGKHLRRDVNPDDGLEKLADEIRSTWSPEVLNYVSSGSTDSEASDTAEAQFAPPIAGFMADDLDREDQLDIEQEVNALCSVIAARDVAPPLSIGLFGDWGVGKSFFMKEMVKRMQVLTGKARVVEERRGQPGYTEEPAYWSDIAQIHFNAWHFIDANLWASLTARIFDGLASHIAQKNARTPEEEQTALYEELELAHEARQALEDQREAVVAERAEKVNRLGEVRDKIAEMREKLDVASAAKTAWSTFRKDNPQIEDSLKKLGLEKTVGSVEDVRSQLREMKGEWGEVRMLLMSFLKGKNMGFERLQLLIVVVIVYLLIKIVMQVLMANSPSIAPFLESLQELLSLAGGGIASLSMWMNKVRNTVKEVEDTYTKEFEQSPEMQQAKAVEARQEAEIEALSAEEARYENELNEMDGRLAMLEQQIADMKVGRRLFRFIEERVSSPDYQEHLGIIALIRRDLDNLSDLLSKNSREKRKAWQNLPKTSDLATSEVADETPVEENKEGVAEVDRIILYIDDLDRCPPERVVEVLQAVHLLLAFKLFVVVVAVDSRWLLRSLEKHYPDFLIIDRQNGSGPGSGFSRLASTPQNYLEKIFQIAFTIKPMDKTGFDSLIDAFTTPAETEEVETTTETETPAAAANVDEGPVSVSQPVSNVAIEAPALAESVANDASAETESTPTAAASAVAENSDSDAGEAEESLNPPHLDIQDHEKEFMKTLYPALRTPRVVNRFVNTYRLVRASAGEDELAKFEDATADDYKAVLTLLAVLTGFPFEAVSIFKAIDQKTDNASWKTFLKGLKPVKKKDTAGTKETPETSRHMPEKTVRYKNAFSENILEVDVPRWLRIERTLLAVNASAKGTMKPYRAWVRRVARFGLHPIRF